MFTGKQRKFLFSKKEDGVAPISQPLTIGVPKPPTSPLTEPMNLSMKFSKIKKAMKGKGV